MIDRNVVRDSQDPRKEFTLFIVFASLNSIFIYMSSSSTIFFFIMAATSILISVVISIIVNLLNPVIIINIYY